MFRPPHYAADIALELANGLTDGTITLESKQSTQRPGENKLVRAVGLLGRREVLQFAGFLGLLATFVSLVVEKLSNPSERALSKQQRLLSKITERLKSLAGESQHSTAPDRTDLRSLEQQLARTNTSSPQYWPTVFTIIAIKSQLVLDVSKLKQQILKIDIGNSPTYWSFENDVVILSGSGRLDHFQFIDCLVSFSDLKEPVTFYDVRFIRCGFFIPSTAAASRPAQKIAEALMAARDPRDLRVSISG